MAITYSMMLSLVKLLAGQNAVKDLLLGDAKQREMQRIASRALSTALHDAIDVPGVSKVVRRSKPRIRSTVEDMLSWDLASNIVSEATDAGRRIEPTIIAGKLMQELARRKYRPVWDSPVETASVLEDVLTFFFAQVQDDLQEAVKKPGSALFAKNVVGQLEALTQGLRGPSRETALELSRVQAANERAYLFNASYNQHDFVDVSISTVLSNMAAICWSENLKFHADRLVRELVALAPTDQIVRRLTLCIEHVDWEGNWERIRSDSLPFLDPGLLTLLEGLRHKARYNDNTHDISRCEDALRDQHWIAGCLSKPTYGRTLPITGSWGSGKSRLLAETMLWCVENEHLAVLVEVDLRISFEDTVVAHINRLLSTSFTTLPAVTAFLMDADLKVFFVIDDVHLAARADRTFLSELVRVVKGSTQGGRFFWVVAADERHLSALLAAGVDDFWIQYGLHFRANRSSNLGGWWFLDEVNVQLRVGLTLLARHGDETDRIEVGSLEEQIVRSDHRYRFLCNPLPAWVRIEAPGIIAQSGLLKSRDEQFMQTYWDQRKTSLVSETILLRDLDNVIRSIVKYIVQTPDSEISFSDLETFAGSELSGKYSPRTSAAELIRCLASAGILKLFEKDDKEGYLSELAQLEPEIFWASRIVRRLFAVPGETAEDQVYVALRRWASIGEAQRVLGEAVAENGLLAASGKRGATFSNFWNRWTADPLAPLTPMLLAVAQINHEQERSVIDCVRTRKFDASDGRLVFAITRFALLASSSDWSAADRFGLLQRFYHDVANNGLSQYLLYCVTKCLGRSDLTPTERYSTIFKRLIGIEETGTGPEVAEAAILCSWDTFHGRTEDWLRCILDFLKSSNNASAAWTTSRSKRENRRSVKQLDSEKHFWELLLGRATDHLMRQEGFDAVRLLVSCGWYTAADDFLVADIVGASMKEEANTSAGTVFREMGPPGYANFDSLLEDLVSGSLPQLSTAEQRETAFYLIRHTVVTRGKSGVKVDARFRTRLAVLCNDKNLRKRVRGSVLKDTAIANGISYT